MFHGTLVVMYHYIRDAEQTGWATWKSVNRTPSRAIVFSYLFLSVFVAFAFVLLRARIAGGKRRVVMAVIIVLVVLLRPDGLVLRQPTGRGLRLFGRTIVPEKTAAQPAGNIDARPLPAFVARQQPAE